MREYKRRSWDLRLVKWRGRMWTRINYTPRDRPRPMKAKIRPKWTGRDMRIMEKNYGFEKLKIIIWLLDGKYSRGAIINKAKNMGLQGRHRQRDAA